MTFKLEPGYVQTGMNGYRLIVGVAMLTSEELGTVPHYVVEVAGEAKQYVPVEGADLAPPFRAIDRDELMIRSLRSQINYNGASSNGG